jgi:hypothetical protein
MSDSNGNSTVMVALIGLATTVAGGVFANWEKIFPPKDPEAMMVAEPAAAGVEPAADAASEPEADAPADASAGAASDNAR